MKPIRETVIVLLIASMGLVSCSPTYTPPRQPHFYTTNTQSTHELTGLRLVHEANFACGGKEVISSVAFLSVASLNYFIEN
jgi:hypothetical protein